MKQRILLIIGLCLSFAVNAQRFQGKLIGGLNASQVEGDRLVGFNKPGIFIGAGVAYPFDDHWSIGGEVLYSQKGARSSEQEFNRFGKWQTIALDYVEFPLIVQYKVAEDINLYGGISPSLLINATIDGGLGAGPQDERRLFQSMDFPFVLGFEYMFWGKVGLNVRWAYSIIPMNVIEIPDETVRLYNSLWFGQTGFFGNSLQFGVRYTFFGVEN